jgi:TPP-dependent indolepyruvate ferredoxin oxidoreductase alpha subunit
MPVILRLTTHVCHAKQKVSFPAWQPPAQVDHTPRLDVGNGPYIPLTFSVAELKQRALGRLEAVRGQAAACGLHRQLDHGNRQRGVIAWGLPFLSLLDALGDVQPKPDILKLGIIYPLDHGQIADFLGEHQEVLVLEELDDLLEKEIKAKAYDLGRLPTSAATPWAICRPTRETCERIHACVAVFGCPTFTRHPDGKIEINPDLWIGDGSCIQTCPTQAITKPAKTGA